MPKPQISRVHPGRRYARKAGYRLMEQWIELIKAADADGATLSRELLDRTRIDACKLRAINPDDDVITRVAIGYLRVLYTPLWHEIKSALRMEVLQP